MPGAHGVQFPAAAAEYVPRAQLLQTDVLNSLASLNVPAGQGLFTTTSTLALLALLFMIHVKPAGHCKATATSGRLPLMLFTTMLSFSDEKLPGASGAFNAFASSVASTALITPSSRNRMPPSSALTVCAETCAMTAADIANSSSRPVVFSLPTCMVMAGWLSARASANAYISTASRTSC